MPFSWDNFPYTNFHELNLDWFIKKFKEIFDEWESLYNTLLQWKEDTNADLAQWKEDTLADMESWENDLLDALDRWKAATGEDIEEWEAGVISDLDDWKDSFLDAYTELESRVKGLIVDTEYLTSLERVINGTNKLLDMGENYIINSSGVWTQEAAKHVRFPVNSGDVVNITSGSMATAYAFLSSADEAEQNVSADFSSATGFTSRIVLNANTNTGDIVTPSDAVLLYIAVQNNRGDNQSPVSVLINGVEMVYNIRNKIDSISSDVNTMNVDLENVKNELNSNANVYAPKNNLDIWGVRGSYDSAYTYVDFSDLTFLDDTGIELYNSGYKNKCDIDLSEMKNNVSGSATVDNQSDLETALSNASINTIYIKKGRYSGITVAKSCNIIGEEGVVFAPSKIAFVQSTTPGIYRTGSNTVSANPVNVYYVRDNDIVFLKHAASTSDVVSTPGSWFWSESVGSVYIHLPYEAETNGDNIIITLATDTSIIKTKATNANAKIYLEKLTVVGGKSNVWSEDSTDSTAQKLIAKRCAFLGASLSNAISLRGVNGYFQNCECAYAYLDGFNYHKNDTANNSSGDNTSTLSNAIEIDCTSHDNGMNNSGTEHSNNGTSVHDGGKCVRINGVYYNNDGANVGDISVNSISYNYGCYAFDSAAPSDTNKADFWAQNGAKAYLYGCRANGGSQYNLWAGSNGAVIYTSKTEYTTHTGTITPM
jgi:hypothetical protein